MKTASDIVIEPWAGTHVQDAFADARILARVLDRAIMVRGNNVEVWVRAETTEEQCRDMYENALAQRRDAAMQRRAMQRRALQQQSGDL